MKASMKFIFIVVLIISISFVLTSDCYAMEDIENTLGKKTTQVMLDEIIESINKSSKITNADVLNTIKDITSLYGLELSDEEIDKIYENIADRITSKITDKITFIDRVKMFVGNLRNWVEETFPELKDKEVVITIPGMSQVDNWVNEGLQYILESVLPWVFS